MNSDEIRSHSRNQARAPRDNDETTWRTVPLILPGLTYSINLFLLRRRSCRRSKRLPTYAKRVEALPVAEAAVEYNSDGYFCCSPIFTK